MTATPSESPVPSPVPPGWSRLQLVLLAAAGIAALGGAAMGLQGASVAGWAAAFLGCFGLSKGLVGVERVIALCRMSVGGADPRAEFASGFLFWAFVIFKWATWMVAWAAAIYVLTHPQAFSWVNPRA